MSSGAGGPLVGGTTTLVPEIEPITTSLIHPLLQDPRFLAALGGLLLIFVLYTVSRPVKQGVARRTGTPTVLLLGPSDGGKTALFTKLVQNEPAQTHTSVTTSVSTFSLKTEQGSKAIRLVDLPGHPRLRDELTKHVKDASAVVFVVDVQSIIRNASSIAEELPRVLISLSNTAYRSGLPIKLLILAHKTDLLIRPTPTSLCPTIPENIRTTAIDRIRTILTREMDRLKAAQTTSGGRIEGIGKVTTSGGTFFGRLFGSKPVVVETDDVEDDESLIWGGKGGFRWEDVDGVEISWGASALGGKDVKGDGEQGEGLVEVEEFLLDA